MEIEGGRELEKANRPRAAGYSWKMTDHASRRRVLVNEDTIHASGDAEKRVLAGIDPPVHAESLSRTKNQIELFYDRMPLTWPRWLSM